MVLEQFLANNLASADAKDKTSGSLNRGCIAHLPLLANSPKVQRATFLGIGGLFCLISMCIIGSFKDPFAEITSLSELYFRFKRFILLVEMKTVTSVKYDSKWALSVTVRDPSKKVHQLSKVKTEFTKSISSTRIG